uniref:Uncharacterized protein n=1 Tax=Candidatus Methanophaga sp. ANME-1 ERB7 TaxID=2759913 RepID=A0A7G9ZBB8_9EURY|nr:hypothetical protein PKDJNKLE_00038 [Methanosarcinales archaeon ANME-1 ERB7]
MRKVKIKSLADLNSLPEGVFEKVKEKKMVLVSS